MSLLFLFFLLRLWKNCDIRYILALDFLYFYIYFSVLSVIRLTCHVQMKTLSSALALNPEMVQDGLYNIR